MKQAHRWPALLAAVCVGLGTWGSPDAWAAAGPNPAAGMGRPPSGAGGGIFDGAWNGCAFGPFFTCLPGEAWDHGVSDGWSTVAGAGRRGAGNGPATAESDRTARAYRRQAETVDGIVWTYTVSGGTASVGTGVHAGDRAVPASTSGAISVPSRLGGYPVRRIADYAFYGCTGLKSVKIPDGVAGIGRYAFSGCVQLAKVTVPDSVGEVGPYAFNACPALGSMALPDKVGTVAEGLFSACQSLESVRLPSGAREIGESAFYRCGALRAVAIPSGVTNIGTYAFYGCGTLKSVDLPAGVRVLAASSFEGCGSLVRAKLPDGLTTVGSRAFKGCGKLESLEIPSGVTVLGARSLEGCGSLGALRIPAGVRSIRPWTFAGCSSLRELGVPEKVERIGEGAFGQCGSLASIVLPDSVEELGAGVFRDCTALVNVMLPSGLKDVPDHAFAGCTALSSLVIPASVTNLGKGIGEWLENVYFLGNAPAHDAEAYSPRAAALTTFAAKGSQGWDGNASSEHLPDTWLGWPIVSWERAGYETEFDANGGIFPDGKETHACGQIEGNVYALPPCEPELEGTVFDGWWTDPTAGMPVGGTTRVDETQGRTFYAHWKSEPVEVTVRFNANGGTVTPAEGTYRAALAYGTLPEAVRKHFRFEGWWTAEDGGIRIEAVNRVPGVDRELFAHWTPETYVLRFQANGGEGTMADQPFSYGSPVTLCSNAFWRAKWAFAGWAVVPGGEVLYADGARVADMPEAVDAAVVLYAVWEKVPLPEIGSDPEVAGVLAEASDGRLADRIRTAGEYAAFRAWALNAKGTDGKTAGAEAVMASEHAWASYVLGAEALFGNEPEIRLEGITVGAPEDSRKTAGPGGGAMTVRVTIRVDGRIAAVDAEKVARLFMATGHLDDWTEEWRLPVSATGKDMAGDGLVFEVMPEDGDNRCVFMRLGE